MLAMGEMTGRFAVIVTAVTGVIIYPTTGQKRLMTKTASQILGGAWVVEEVARIWKCKGDSRNRK